VVDSPLFAGLPPEEVARWRAAARRRQFRRGEVVFHYDDPGDTLHVVTRGRFAVRVMTPLGDVVTLALRGPGEAFGEMALIDDGARRSATVAALEEAETYSLLRADFDRLRRDNPQITDALVRLLGSELRRVNERLLEALYVPADRRVLRRVLELGERYAAAGEPVHIPLTQEEIAAMAGTSRATVNRVLRHEEAGGAVRLQRGRVEIVDIDRLRRRAR
jgi:CRP/FNR family transcriptional regulator, cyclic AMP receptor protein